MSHLLFSIFKKKFFDFSSNFNKKICVKNHSPSNIDNNKNDLKNKNFEKNYSNKMKIF